MAQKKKGTERTSTNLFWTSAIATVSEKEIYWVVSKLIRHRLCILPVCWYAELSDFSFADGNTIFYPKIWFKLLSCALQMERREKVEIIVWLKYIIGKKNDMEYWTVILQYISKNFLNSFFTNIFLDNNLWLIKN